MKRESNYYLRESDKIMSAALNKELNKQVATWSVMYTKLHNFHWYVKGPSFFILNAIYQQIEKHQWMLNAFLGDTNTSNK